MKEEYRVYWTDDRGEIIIAVMKRGHLTSLPYLHYRVKGDASVIERNYHELKAVLDLMGGSKHLGVFADLDRESILAVVPQWEKVI